jgi:hypothetical protein
MVVVHILKNVFRKIELKKLANSELGAKLSFSKIVNSFLGSIVANGELSSQSYYATKTFYNIK